jgi:SPX domain protein involved in polyphosphate accumulation
VEQIVRNHPAGFRKVFPDRWVNNLYFDDVDLSAVYDNFAGIANRQKARLRWYGPAFPDSDISARLELKVRSNQLGHKVVKKLPVLSFHTLETLLDQICHQWPGAAQRRAVLINRYRRAYYTAANNGIRLTIDRELQFAEPFAGFRSKRFSLTTTGSLMELKYHPDKEADAEWIMQHLPFRVSKYSKYVTGLLALYGQSI